MKIKDHSQAGQTRFVDALTPYPGTFLDVGAAGLSISNTLGLEESGWTGWLVDNSTEARDASAARKAKFFCMDATQLDYSFLPKTVDYLSLDVDEASLDAMIQILKSGTVFGVVTAEHDFYRNGERLRTPMIELLTGHGYEILCSDVCHEGKSFEVWAVHPRLVNMTMAFAEKFRRDKPTDWREILNVD